MADARGRIAAVDYGTKRVGIAVTDPLGLFPQPYGTFSPAEAVAALQQLQADDGLQAIIVGWPLTAEGEEGRATRRVQQYINRLRNALGPVDLVKWDERYTTIEARERLHATDRSKKRLHRRTHRGRVDEAAAGLMLQEFLNQR